MELENEPEELVPLPGEGIVNQVPELRAGAIVLDGDPAEGTRRPGRIGAAEASA